MRTELGKPDDWSFFAGTVSAPSLTSCATLSSFGSTGANDDGRMSRDEATRSPELSAAFGRAMGPSRHLKKSDQHTDEHQH